VNGNSSFIKPLIEAGALINAIDRLNKNSLHWAARFDNKNVSETLLELGINYNKRDIEGKTALDVAIRYKNQDVIKVIRKFD